MYLAHFGIKGQQWGVRNGPPYPLDGATKSGLTRRQRRYKNRDLKNVSDEELSYIVNRLRLEQQYNQYVGNYTPGEASKRIINKSLDKSVDTAFKIGTNYLWDDRNASLRRH